MCSQDFEVLHIIRYISRFAETQRRGGALAFLADVESARLSLLPGRLRVRGCHRYRLLGGFGHGGLTGARPAPPRTARRTAHLDSRPADRGRSGGHRRPRGRRRCRVRSSPGGRQRPLDPLELGVRAQQAFLDVAQLPLQEYFRREHRLHLLLVAVRSEVFRDGLLVRWRVRELFNVPAREALVESGLGIREHYLVVFLGYHCFFEGKRGRKVERNRRYDLNEE